MKVFAKHIFWFCTPLLALWLITSVFYKKTKGDLARLAKVDFEQINDPAIVDAQNQPILYQLLSGYQQKKSSKKTVLVLGDSFAALGNVSFQNYLAQDSNLIVVYCDLENVVANPIALLSKLLNGDFFEKMHFDFVVLESVERNIVQRGNLNLSEDTLSFKDLYQQFAKEKSSAHLTKKTSTEKRNQLKMYISDVVNYPIYKALYLFNNHAFLSPVYAFSSSEELFSNSEKIFVYEDDVKNAPVASHVKGVKKLNGTLHALHEKLQKNGTKLFVLPAPDKYDVYYPYIKNNTALVKPRFFEEMENLPKRYLYINSKKLLQTQLPTTANLYLANDSHWSPKAAQLVAKSISATINKSSKK